MDDRDALADALTNAGFSQYEADVYLSVLEVTDANVADIARVSSVPRSRVYGVLRDLEHRGILETYDEDSLRARVTDPSTVAEELNEQSQQFSDAATAIEEMWEQPPIRQNNARVFQSHSTTVEEAREQLLEAETIVHLVVSLDELEALQDALATLRKRNIIVQIVLHGGYRELDDPAELAVDYSAVATEVRFCTSLLPFLTMIDGDLTIFGVQSRHGDEYGIVIDDHVHSSILHWYFQIQLWEPWDTIYAAAETDETTYISIREFIRDIESMRKSGEQVTVRVDGIETLSGEPVRIAGTLDDIVYTDSNVADAQPFSQLFIQAAIVVSDDDENYTIGGYGAILEDIRAIRITVLSIE